MYIYIFIYVCIYGPHSNRPIFQETESSITQRYIYKYIYSFIYLFVFIYRVNPYIHICIY